MRKLDYCLLVSNLFQYKTICDENHNEYVLFAHSTLERVTNIMDRTQFEACENHVHLVNNLQKSEYQACISIAQNLGKALLYCLHSTYPKKHFIVFVSLRLKDSMIIRFHQKWENEDPYYNVSDFTTERETVFKFEV